MLTYMKTLKTILCLLLGCLWANSVSALIPTNHKQRLTTGWEFIRQDMGSIWEVMRPVPGAGKPEAVPLWQKVTLPHCFNAEDAVDPDVNYYQGTGWYRTTLHIDNPYKDGRIYLEFEGAGQNTEVYVYTTLVASHTGGYDEWKADITKAVEQFRSTPACRERFGGKIPVAIRCDNSRDTETIPSDMSDFNLYGGIYRYVNLVYTPAHSIGQVQINARTTPGDKLGKVEWQVTTERPLSASPSEGVPELRITVLSPEGRKIYQDSYPLQDTCRAWFALKSPTLWSPDSPALYTFQAQLIAGGTDTLLTHTEHFGFRHIRFEEKGPFYLNGQRLLLRGTHRHEDHAGVGAALTEEMMIAEMKQIKAMGANFIRLGHYQQSEIILRLCDELGLLVWEEIPWCRGGLGGEKYREQARRMLTNMIDQHRNHPSVILWGMGNENDWPGDFEQFERDSIRAFMKELHALSHRLDATRLTVIRRCDFCKDIVDVYSPSIWAGWYSHRFRDYREMETAGMNSTTRFLHAEWGGDSHAGRHAEEIMTEGRSSFDIEAGDRNGDWSESYIVRLFDWHLKEQEQMPWLTGSAFWTFKDFSTPLRPQNPIPYVNQKGVVQRDGTPKESYYVFQSYWSTEPMVHIYGHTWPVRWGQAGEPKEVLVYSNCPEVELFVNGTSMGCKKRDSQDFPAAGLHWNVVLQEGENKLEAIAHHGKLCLSDQIVQTYQTRPWSEPAEIRLTQIPLDAQNVLVQAEVVDRTGTRCLDAGTFIEFGCTDHQALQQNQGTAYGSRRIQAANGRACIRVKRGANPVVVGAQDAKRTLRSALITIK